MQIRSSYDIDGAVPLSITGGVVAQNLRALGLEQFETRADPDSRVIPFPITSTEVFQVHNMSRHHEDFASLATGHFVQQALTAIDPDGDWQLWQDRLILQGAHEGGTISWHQDAAYSPYGPGTRICSIWLNLSDAADAPMLFVVPGSHAWGRQDRVLRGLGERHADDPIPADAGGRDVIHRACTVPFGGLHAHDGLVWHAPNLFTCNSIRVAYGMYFVDARQSTE